jgi:CheY-like chemotaxis protein
MDGFVATGKIRQTEKKRRLSRTMIVALTGLTSAESRNRAFDAGVDEYYAKPGK